MIKKLRIYCGNGMLINNMVLKKKGSGEIMQHIKKIFIMIVSAFLLMTSITSGIVTIKAQDDVDVLAIDRSGKKAIFMECKFTSSPMPLEEYTDLVNATKAFPNIEEIYLYFVSKSGYTEPVKRQAEIDCAILLTIYDLFE